MKRKPLKYLASLFGNIPADIYFGVVNEIRAPWSLDGVCNNYSTGDVPCFIVESQSKQTWVRRTPPFQLNLSLQVHGVPVVVQCPSFKYSLASSLGLKLLCLSFLSVIDREIKTTRACNSQIFKLYIFLNSEQQYNINYCSPNTNGVYFTLEKLPLSFLFPSFSLVLWIIPRTRLIFFVSYPCFIFFTCTMNIESFMVIKMVLNINISVLRSPDPKNWSKMSVCLSKCCCQFCRCVDPRLAQKLLGQFCSNFHIAVLLSLEKCLINCKNEYKKEEKSGLYDINCEDCEDWTNW